MITDKFTLLLEDLSEHLSMPLTPDENHSCLLLIQEKLEVQLQLDPTQTHLVIGSNLGELPSGRFRQDCLLAALKANARPYPRLGTFAYSRKLNSLIIFEKLELEVFDTNNILSILTPFIQKAMTWGEALENGQSQPSREPNYQDMSDNTDFFGG